MTIHTDSQENPFRLTFGQDVIILIEIRWTLNHVFWYFGKINNWLKDENFNLLGEEREMAHIQSITYKETIKKYFDKQV